MHDELVRETGSTDAIPWDSADINIYYANLNTDNIIDALIAFEPYRCDGRCGGLDKEVHLLVLSQGDNYSVIDDYFNKFNDKIGNGFLYLDSIVTKTFFGTYYEYTKEDPRCCPSIQRPIKIDLETNEFQYLDNKKTSKNIPLGI